MKWKAPERLFVGLSNICVTPPSFHRDTPGCQKDIHTTFAELFQTHVADVSSKKKKLTPTCEELRQGCLKPLQLCCVPKHWVICDPSPHCVTTYSLPTLKVPALICYLHSWTLWPGSHCALLLIGWANEGFMWALSTSNQPEQQGW